MNLRKIHTWASMLLILPILIVGGTAILIAHHDGLNTGSVFLPFGSTEAPKGAESRLIQRYEIRAVAQDDDGSRLYAGKYGLMRAREGGSPVLGEGLKADIRDLDRLPSGVWVAAAKQGLFVRSGSDGPWTKIAPDDFKSLSRVEGGFLATAEQQVWRVNNRGFAEPEPAWLAPLEQQAALGDAPPYTLEKLVMDLHTGKFFFGKTGEWIWIDLVGGAMVLLGVTGVVIWRRAEAAKAKQAVAKHAGAKQGPQPVQSH